MTNMGMTDRRLRAILVAPALIIIGVLVGPTGWLSVVLYLLAVVMLATSAKGFCPLYAPFGLSTCPAPTGRDATTGGGR